MSRSAAGHAAAAINCSCRRCDRCRPWTYRVDSACSTYRSRSANPNGSIARALLRYHRGRRRHIPPLRSSQLGSVDCRVTAAAAGVRFASRTTRTPIRARAHSRIIKKNARKSPLRREGRSRVSRVRRKKTKNKSLQRHNVVRVPT